MNLIYLYCITGKAPVISNVQSLVDNLFNIHHKGLYALASKVCEEEFGAENLKKNLNDLGWLEKKASAHEKVIEEILKDTSVVPLRFATLFNTLDNLKAVLEEHNQTLKENLKNLRGKQEWGIKIYCDTQKLSKNLSRINKNYEFLKVNEAISSSSPGKAFFLKKKKEEILNKLVNKRLNEYCRSSFDRLKKQSFQACVDKLLPKEATGRNDQMILNAAYLVDVKRVSFFINTVDVLKEEYKDNGLLFDITGPWPPYNFCLPVGKAG